TSMRIRYVVPRYRWTGCKHPVWRRGLEPVKSEGALRVPPRKRYWRSIHMKHLSLVKAVSIATLALAPSAVSAQQKSLSVAGSGGSFEKTIRDEVIPAFEQANGVKVEYVAGNS